MILRKMLSGVTWLLVVFLAWVFAPMTLTLAVVLLSDGMQDVIGESRENSAAFLGFLILVVASQVAWWVILAY